MFYMTIDYLRFDFLQKELPKIPLTLPFRQNSSPLIKKSNEYRVTLLNSEEILHFILMKSTRFISVAFQSTAHLRMKINDSAVTITDLLDEFSLGLICPSSDKVIQRRGSCHHRRNI